MSGYAPWIPAAAGMTDAGARWYDPSIGRFMQADSIVPEPGNPQSLNRYSYVLNNPMRYTDPSGHVQREEGGGQYLTMPSNLMDEENPIAYIVGELYRYNTANITEQLSELNSAASGLLNAPKQSAVEAFLCLNAAYQSKKLAIEKWVGLVATNRPLDYKTTIRGTWHDSSQIEGVGQFQYDIWANISYGYVGIRAAWPEQELLVGAGLANVWDAMQESDSRKGWIRLVTQGKVTLGTYGDDVRDQNFIGFGNALAEKYPLIVSESQLLRIFTYEFTKNYSNSEYR